MNYKELAENADSFSVSCAVIVRLAGGVQFGDGCNASFNLY